jgi:hypothetical protein
MTLANCLLFVEKATLLALVVVALVGISASVLLALRWSEKPPNIAWSTLGR